jgi:hypothetical protein
MFGAEFNEEPTRMVEFFIATLQPYLARPGKLSAVEASLLLHRAYLLRYGLATEAELDHNPASLCKMRDAEDPYLGTQLEEHFEHFLDLEIFEYMTWEYYITLPRHEMQMIRRVAERRRKLKNSAADNTLKEAEALARQLGTRGG